MLQGTKRAIIGGVIAVVIIIFWLQSQFGAVQSQANLEQFVIPPQSKQEGIVQNLHEQGFIKNSWAFNIARNFRDTQPIKPGGFAIAKSMSVWQIVDVLNGGPNALWVVIPEGARKEQIADILGETFNWTGAEKGQWITQDTAQKPEYTEGVYFPDTYLIPKNETGAQIARRLIDRFNKEFVPYAQKFQERNIRWDTALIIASLIQREAGGKDDMPIIAGVIWNRLALHMRLEIDATLQYAKGRSEQGWWGSVTPADKQISSPYNTYRISGLPPHPIANPGLDAIEATLNPAQTPCLYYLHDHTKQIHCAQTYQEHQKNIETYLR